MGIPIVLEFFLWKERMVVLSLSPGEMTPP